MPDKPKRRKNNKNKRKNRNHRPDPNKTNVSVNQNETLPSETGSDERPETSSTYESDSKLASVLAVTVQSSPLQVNDGTNSMTVTTSSEFQESTDDLTTNEINIDSQSLCPADTYLDDVERSSQISECYVVESPENSLKNKCKLNNNVKSKSLDNDDAPKITELSDEVSVLSEDENTLSIIENNNILVTDVDSDIEWEKLDEGQENTAPVAKEIATESLSVSNMPLSIAQCDETKSLTPEAERSLRNYLKTLNLSIQPADSGSIEIKTEIEQIINREIRHRLRKKGLADDFFCQRLGPPRILDVIDEEGSSESSATSRRQSHLSDKKSDVEDLEDDVFEDDKKIIEKFSAKAIKSSNTQKLIPQECFLVGAKMKEPEITEARGDWSIKTVEKLSGAEVVYLTDTSSSTSSIQDLCDETDDTGVETDVSVRMITPTIEVTDTESLLKKTFSTNSDTSKKIENGFNNKNGFDKNDVEPFENNKISSNHEIVVLSTDNIKTNLYVKELDDESSKIKDDNNSMHCDKYDIEMKVLKCELNDAINNLIKEVSSDSENVNENSKESFARQDSSSSVGSSQCTAKYNPTYSSLNDVSNMHDEVCDTKQNFERTYAETSSHVKDVFECVTGTASLSKNPDVLKQPTNLRDLCVKKIATLPFGQKILEELASVSEKLQNITIFGSNSTVNANQEYSNKTLKENCETEKKMPYYPLPDVSTIETVSLENKSKESVPPPVQPRNSSLKKAHDEHWTGLPTKTAPVYICLSPSQKMLMEKTNTVPNEENASQLIEMHKKFVDRRGYSEQKPIKSEKLDQPPVVPFKSQTGSRLLALIRDPAVTNNINTSMHKRCNQSLDHIEKSYSRVEQMSKRIREQFNSINDFSASFKPIPPPRPRKYSSSFYESDESSDFTDSSFRSMKSERKFFHYSTGTLNKEIENDISEIQNMHRNCQTLRNETSSQIYPRRPSLPKDLCEQQMEYIRRKEKEVEAEIRRLEAKKLNVQPVERKGPRAPLIVEKNTYEEKHENDNLYRAHKKDMSINTNDFKREEKCKLSSAFSSSQEEILRDKMYSEYMSQMAAREERKQHKIIKITNYPTSTTSNKKVSKSMPTLDTLDSKVNNRIEKEFICKARERWEKLGIKDPETEDERESSKDVYKEPKVIEHKIKVIEGDEEKDVKKLPNHLQDFVRFTAKDKDQGSDGSGESAPDPASPHVVILCAVIIFVIAVGKFFLRLLRNI